MLLAEGAIDIAAEFDVKPWDIAALVPIVREAGGTVTSVTGDDRLDGLSILASNGGLHQSVLQVLAAR
jgi:histidinol-phosphatase